MITKKEYNIVMIDTANSTGVLEALIEYGKRGWAFVAWVDGPQISTVLPHLKYGIFVKDTDIPAEI